MTIRCGKCDGLVVIERDVEYQTNAVLYVHRCVNCGRRVIIGRTTLATRTLQRMEA